MGSHSEEPVTAPPTRRSLREAQRRSESGATPVAGPRPDPASPASPAAQHVPSWAHHGPAAPREPAPVTEALTRSAPPQQARSAWSAGPQTRAAAPTAPAPARTDAATPRRRRRSRAASRRPPHAARPCSSAHVDATPASVGDPGALQRVAFPGAAARALRGAPADSAARVSRRRCRLCLRVSRSPLRDLACAGRGAAADSACAYRGAPRRSSRRGADRRDPGCGDPAPGAAHDGDAPRHLTVRRPAWRPSRSRPRCRERSKRSPSSRCCRTGRSADAPASPRAPPPG